MLDEWLRQDVYAQVMITVLDRAPLLAIPRLARCALAEVVVCGAAQVPGELWGAVVLPEGIKLLLGPASEDVLPDFVDVVKERTAAPLLDMIRRADDDTLDMVLRYTPVWGGTIYRVWQAGFHCTTFLSEYRLSNALYEMQQAPVEAGLVSSAADWPYIWVGGEDA